MWSCHVLQAVHSYRMSDASSQATIVSICCQEAMPMPTN